MDRISRCLLGVAVLTVLLVGVAGACNSCPCTCSVDCALLTSIHCDDGERVTLTNGADLDFNGHFIVCDTPTGCSGAAVRVTSSPSIITNTGSPNYGILGPWSTGVDCQSTASSTVRRIGIWGFTGTGISRCAKVENNVLAAASGGAPTGIHSSGLANTDFVRSNHVQGAAAGILVTGSKATLVRSNIVVDRPGPSTGIWLYQATSTGLQVDRNVIMHGDDTDQPIVGNATAVFAENQCHTGTLGCQDCIADGYCAEAAAPFIYP